MYVYDILQELYFIKLTVVAVLSFTDFQNFHSNIKYTRTKINTNKIWQILKTSKDICFIFIFFFICFRLYVFVYEFETLN